MSDEETAALLREHFSTLKQLLNCDENKTYLCRWPGHDWHEPGAQETMIRWLAEETKKVMEAFEDLSVKN